jgi:GDPmannose 4,6-dehydratase
MLQQAAPGDLVFGTGATHSVREFVEEAFGYVNLDWRNYVTEAPRYRRPTEVPLLQADPSEAKRRLGWEPRGTFRDLVRIMVDADLEAADLPAPGQRTHCLTDGRLAWLRRP